MHHQVRLIHLNNINSDIYTNISLLIVQYEPNFLASHIICKMELLKFF